MAQRNTKKPRAKVSDTEKLIAATKIDQAHQAELAPFEASIHGDDYALLVAIKGLPCEDFSTSPDIVALQKSLEPLGFSGDCLCTLDASEGALTPSELQLIIESTDPIAIVLLDSVALAKFDEAYRIAVRQAMQLREGVRAIFGRKVVFIDDFSKSLDDPALKREAWARLKMLSRNHD